MQNKSSNPPMTSFQKSVYEVTKRIPRGKVATYSVVASALGMPRASRAVGTALSKNRSSEVPCHRVVRSDGTLGGYTWGLPKKAVRLREEGVEISNNHVDLSRYGVHKVWVMSA